MKFEYFFPKLEVLKREIPYTLCTIFFSVVAEVLALHCYSTGIIPKENYYFDWNKHKWWTFLWFGLMPSWRDGHFWWIHRMMHPWHTNKYARMFPDIG